MKKRILFILSIFIFVAEIAALSVFALQTSTFPQDAVDVNETLQSVTNDFYNIKNHKNQTDLKYVVLDNEHNIVYRTNRGLSENINAAIAHRDTILDITVDNTTVGKLIIYNDDAHTLKTQKQRVIIILTIAVTIQCAICVSYAFYLYIAVIKPFRKLKKFAAQVAGGNLEIPLVMDRRNIFGAFTESFDIMRSELKKARLAEAQAQQSKKELVAKLSHDIKTPVASIKALSEVGLAISRNTKDKQNYTRIVEKTDQINSLVGNLFSATLEELQQLDVTPSDIESGCIKSLLENADYMHRAIIPDIPQCLISVDKLRLQQVFDNIFANSYKYADTEIRVTVDKADSKLSVIIEDSGGGVPLDELPFLKEKFRRGGNSKNIEGAGLGLYISDRLMKQMQGTLDIENGDKGLKVTVTILLSGKI